MKESKTLIIGLVVFVFLVLVVAGSYFSGRTEVTEPNNIAITLPDPNELVLTWVDSVYLEITLTDEPTFEDGETRIYLYKGDDFDIVIEKKEPNEPLLKIETETTDAWLEEHLKEPNEPEYKWFCSCGKGIRKMSIYECGDCGKVYNSFDVILKNIPTWPDYIELEKDLVIDMSHKNDPNYPASYYTNWEIPKGAKIYFKE